MQQSESIANLAAALVKVQPKLQHPRKQSKQQRFGKFADLGEVMRTNRNLLADHGLAVVQAQCSGQGADGRPSVGVATRLVHESGEWVGDECLIPLLQENKANCLAQIAGGNIKYLRRYGWQTILGLDGEDDDDGESLRGGDAPTSRDVDDLL